MSWRQGMIMMLCCAAGCSLLPRPVVAQTPEAAIVDSATAVLQETMMIPAEKIPLKLLSDARGIAIIPNVLKGGFVVGIRHGRGVMLVRDQAGNWQPPSFVSITGGSVGWQAGLQATDLILVFRTRQSVDNLLRNKLTLGVDAAAAAGPVGRTAAASTDLMLRAEILSYSRSRGLFAGISLDGSSLQMDSAAGQAFYAGTGMTAQGVPGSPTAAIPPSAARLIAQLNTYTDGDESNDRSVPVANLNPATPAADNGLEPLRQQLNAAASQLNGLLDDQWKQYLALPVELTSAQTPVSSMTLASVTRRYETVAADPRFAPLAQRPEFAAVYRLLQDYAAVLAKVNAPTLALPPPPVELPAGQP
jgi:lipid-binding SYLF domain-containing protein